MTFIRVMTVTLLHFISICCCYVQVDDETQQNIKLQDG